MKRRARRRAGARNEGAAIVCLELEGERIEVRFDASGIHFRHPDDSAARGDLPWDLALAVSMLPQEARASLTRRVA
jgi:hypothetical protein